MRIWLVVVLMICAATVDILRVYLGIPKFTMYTRISAIVTISVLTLNYSVILLAFIVEQMETRRREAYYGEKGRVL